MKLWEDLAFGAAAPPVVAIVGGGGKTTLLYRLGRKAHARGLRAVLAGTTRFTPAPDGRMPPLLRGEQHVHRPERVRAIAGDDATVCDVAVLVNKADLAREHARELAIAQRDAGVPRVVVVALREERNPVIEALS